MFGRTLQKSIESVFFTGKIIVLVGPRQVGKTTLMKKILSSYTSSKKITELNGDYIKDRELLGSENLALLKESFHHSDIIFIDEGQKIQNIGETLKILIDLYGSSKQIIVTGSSGFHLLSGVSESLAGRKRVFYLFPLSFREISDGIGFSAFHSSLEQFLITGMYPAVVTKTDLEEKKAELQDLASSALYKDILEFQALKNANALTHLLKMLALQIGQEISLHSLGKALSMDSRTVERYIDLLEKSYIIFRVPPFFSNKKKELIKMQKIYFYDLGIRNALLGNFLSLENRNDVGALWENWIVMEYKKKGEFLHFWRGINRQEVDIVLEKEGKQKAIEIKWKMQHSSLPSLFAHLYPFAEYAEIHRENYFEFL